MRNSFRIGDNGIPTYLATATDALKLELALAHFDRTSMPPIRLTDPDGNVETIRLGQTEQVTVSRGPVGEDTITRVSKELDDSDTGVIDVAVTDTLDFESIFRSIRPIE